MQSLGALEEAEANAATDDARFWPFVRRYRIIITAVVLYLLWRRATASATSSIKPWGPRWLAALTGLAFSRLMSVVGKIPVFLHPPSKPVDDSKQYTVVWHPHGAYTTMAFMHTGYHTVMKQPLTWFPGARRGGGRESERGCPCSPARYARVGNTSCTPIPTILRDRAGALQRALLQRGRPAAQRKVR